MATEPIDCTGTAFESHQCVSCRDYVVVAQGFVGKPMCLGCRRESEGIDWPWFEPFGEWHPTVGYPRELPSLPVVPVHDSPWRWACVRCRMNGQADNAEHALALQRTHDAYACPAVPWINESERALRVGRRADMTRRYPEQAPAWAGPAK
jgi:hypothetical protein